MNNHAANLCHKIEKKEGDKGRREQGNTAKFIQAALRRGIKRMEYVPEAPGEETLEEEAEHEGAECLPWYVQI